MTYTLLIILAITGYALWLSALIGWINARNVAYGYRERLLDVQARYNKLKRNSVRRDPKTGRYVKD